MDFRFACSSNKLIFLALPRDTLGIGSLAISPLGHTYDLIPNSSSSQIDDWKELLTLPLPHAYALF